MDVLVVTFNLDGVTDADYRNGCEDEAPAFVDVPGLIAKIWLADEQTNTYGGVYTFVDRESLDAYTRSDLFKSIGADPSVANLEARRFDALEGPTRTTRGWVAKTA